MTELNNEDILALLISKKADEQIRTSDLLITNQIQHFFNFSPKTSYIAQIDD